MVFARTRFEMRIVVAIVASALSFGLLGCDQQQSEKATASDQASPPYPEANAVPPPQLASPGDASISCKSRLEQYARLPVVAPDLSEAPNFTRANFIQNPEFVTTPIDLDHDGDLEIVVIGDEQALGPQSILTHSALLLTPYVPGSEPLDVARATELAKTTRPSKGWIKSVSFAALNSGLTLQGALVESLPLLSYADIEIGKVSDEPLIRAVVTELVPPLDPATGQPTGAPQAQWTMLIRLKPDWTAEAICADPVSTIR